MGDTPTSEVDRKEELLSKSFHKYYQVGTFGNNEIDQKVFTRTDGGPCSMCMLDMVPMNLRVKFEYDPIRGC